MRVITVFSQTFSPQSPSCSPSFSLMTSGSNIASHSLCFFSLTFPGCTRRTGLSTCWRKATAHHSWWVAGWIHLQAGLLHKQPCLIATHSPPSPFDHSRRSSPSQHMPLGSPSMESQCWKTGCSNALRFNILLEVYSLVVWYLSRRRNQGTQAAKLLQTEIKGKLVAGFLEG